MHFVCKLYCYNRFYILNVTLMKVKISDIGHIEYVNIKMKPVKIQEGSYLATN